MDIKRKIICIMLSFLSSFCIANELKVVDENGAMLVSAVKQDQTLVLELQPKDGALIPLDPGIKVASEEGKAPITFLKSERYMDEPETISLKMPEDHAPVDLRIVHAYCPTEDICQFLDLDIHIP